MRAALRSTGLGFALGAGWGVFARVWMRWVSTDHSFSWAGTLGIIGVAATAGALLGLVHAARQRRGSRWWRLAAVPTLLLFAGAGIPLLPAYLLGGWAWGSRRVPAVFRSVAALPLVGLPVYGWVTADWTVHVLINPWLAIGGFLVLEAMLAAAGAVVFRPWSSRSVATAPRSLAMA